ncbi:MAG: hypothetical protein K0V04_15245 [Deltaproteobacteria bacterium]|nr:hypothetical protein [Deltaproteobacteria bacterium]
MVEPLDPQTRLLVLALAVEEDSGRGLATLFAQLESSDTMMAWTYATDVPVPTAVPELAAGDQLAPDLGHRIHIMMGDRDPSVRLDGDDWIDANLVWTQAARARRRYRLHFVSADERNDWTAELELWLRRA